jgi:hypothetical protein
MPELWMDTPKSIPFVWKPFDPAAAYGMRYGHAWADSSNGNLVSIYDGSDWQPISAFLPPSVGAAGQVGYFSSPGNITSESALQWEASAGHLGIGTTLAPTQPLEIVMTGLSVSSASPAHTKGVSVTNTISPPTNSTAAFYAFDGTLTIPNTITGNVSTAVPLNSVVRNFGPTGRAVTNMFGLAATVLNDSEGGTVTTLRGYSQLVAHRGKGALTNAYGNYIEVVVNNPLTGGATANVTNVFGIDAIISNNTTGTTATITNAYVARLRGPGGTGPITTIQGLRVLNMGRSGVTNAYGVFMDAQSGASTLNYALWIAGGQSWHSGNFGIGSSTMSQTPGAPLHVSPSDAVTNTTTLVTIFGHESSATPAASFGGQHLYRLKSSTTSGRSAADLIWQWDTATDASRKGALILRAYDATAAREGLKIGADGTNPLIGFLGKAPVARPSAYTLTGSATRIMPSDPSSAFTGIDNAQVGSVYATLADLNTVRSALSSVLGVLRSILTDFGHSSGFGLLNA